MKVRVGSRGSDLARAQCGTVLRTLQAAGIDTELIIVETVGDKDKERPFAEIGAPGVFVREIERALLDGRIDLAVHSYKDLPSASPEGLTIVAIPPRADPRDVLVVHPDAWRPGERLPVAKGAVFGSASARRRALLAESRPDLELVNFRGNVPTRVRKVRDREVDATLLAAAGLDRLRELAADTIDLEGLHLLPLDSEWFVPAPAQGALAVQIRAGEEELATRVREACDDPATRHAVTAERMVLSLSDGGCEIALGAHAIADAGGELTLHVALGLDDGLRRARVRGADPEELGRAGYQALRGGDA